jgi:hypothetical protein
MQDERLRARTSPVPSRKTWASPHGLHGIWMASCACWWGTANCAPILTLEKKRVLCWFFVGNCEMRKWQSPEVTPEAHDPHGMRKQGKKYVTNQLENPSTRMITVVPLRCSSPPFCSNFSGKTHPTIPATSRYYQTAIFGRAVCAAIWRHFLASHRSGAGSHHPTDLTRRSVLSLCRQSPGTGQV